MNKKDLPIDRMSGKESANFRRGLDELVLTAETLREIKKAFDLNPKDTKSVRVCCNEAHAHSYKCLEFDNNYSAIVLRLLNEIENYQARLDRIREETDYRK